MKPVLFIHGMFMTPLCWENWLTRFHTRGYTCVAPAYQYHDGEPSALRAQHPNPALARLTLGGLVAQYTEYIRGMDETPILIGHSMGGLITQILLSHGLGAAGIAIDSAPPRGVFAVSIPFLKSNFPIINPLQSNDVPLMMTPEQFGYAFTNTLPPPEQRATYARYSVPESRRVGQGSLSPDGHVEYANVHVPLLLTSGEKDNIVPPQFNRANYAKYRGAPNVALKEFSGRSHWLIAEPNWQQVADYTLNWLHERDF